MKLKVLGCDGGRGIGYNTTSLLFNDTVMIDAGTIQSKLTIDEALNVTDIFFTHTHLDHIIDLPFLLDATFEKRKNPLNIHGTKEAIDNMMTHIFNNKVWPNFSELPTKDSGQFKINYIESGKTYEIGNLKFTPILVDHTVKTVGYKVDDGHGSLIFSGDTGPVDSLWKVANETENLEAMILDLSFPISEQAVADVSKHMTASDIEKELKKLKQDCDVYVFHFKVGMKAMLKGQAAHVTHFGKPLKALSDFHELVI